VRLAVEDRDVTLAQQARQRAHAAGEAAVEQDAVLLAEERRQLALERAVQVAEARQQRRAAGPGAVGPQRLARGRDDLGVGRQPEVVVRAQVDHLAAHAGALDRHVRADGAEHVRLVHRHRPRAFFGPPDEALGRLQRIVAVRKVEVGQTVLGFAAHSRISPARWGPA
jgi:hypothetical protein